MKGMLTAAAAAIAMAGTAAIADDTMAETDRPCWTSGVDEYEGQCWRHGDDEIGGIIYVRDFDA